MAIDSTLWFADIPAGDYTVGDVVELKVKAGPANVRSGRGTALLKSIIVGTTSGTTPLWKIHVKNSNWVDDVQSFAGQLTQATSLSMESGNVQVGCNDVLLPNSGWSVWAECVAGGTSSAPNSLFALIDLDYPSVSAVADPLKIDGIPTSIPFTATVPVHAYGSAEAATWSVVSVDYFKAGYAYCLQAVEIIGGAPIVFLALSNAAGMGGLTRIILLNNLVYGVRAKIWYSSKLVKGPMDVKVMAFNTSSSPSQSLVTIHDYVKKLVSA